MPVLTEFLRLYTNVADGDAEDKKADPRTQIVRKSKALVKAAESKGGGQIGQLGRAFNNFPLVYNHEGKDIPAIEPEIMKSWIVELRGILEKADFAEKQVLGAEGQAEGLIFWPKDEKLTNAALINLLNKIVFKACEELLDDKGNIKPEIIVALKLETVVAEAKDNPDQMRMIVNQLVFSYCSQVALSNFAAVLTAGVGAQQRKIAEQRDKDVAADVETAAFNIKAKIQAEGKSLDEMKETVDSLLKEAKKEAERKARDRAREASDAIRASSDAVNFGVTYYQNYLQGLMWSNKTNTLTQCIPDMTKAILDAHFLFDTPLEKQCFEKLNLLPVIPPTQFLKVLNFDLKRAQLLDEDVDRAGIKVKKLRNFQSEKLSFWLKIMELYYNQFKQDRNEDHFLRFQAIFSVLQPIMSHTLEADRRVKDDAAEGELEEKFTVSKLNVKRFEELTSLMMSQFASQKSGNADAKEQKKVSAGVTVTSEVNKVVAKETSVADVAAADAGKTTVESGAVQSKPQERKRTEAISLTPKDNVDDTELMNLLQMADNRHLVDYFIESVKESKMTITFATKGLLDEIQKLKTNHEIMQQPSPTVLRIILEKAAALKDDKISSIVDKYKTGFFNAGASAGKQPVVQTTAKNLFDKVAAVFKGLRF